MQQEITKWHILKLSFSVQSKQVADPNLAFRGEQPKNGDSKYTINIDAFDTSIVLQIVNQTSDENISWLE